MTKKFRLLQVSRTNERSESLSEPTQPNAGSDNVEFSQNSDNVTQPWVSVIIGKNGAGKSRLLAGIADFFDKLERRSSRLRNGSYPLLGLSYSSDDRFCEVETDSNDRLRAKIDGRPCELAELPLPTKIIALTTTPFDKFRVSRSSIGVRESVKSNMPERYAYLGLRDRTGRASPTAAIFRAIEGLFEASSSEENRRLRIAEVFRFLGYKPHVDVRYEFSLQGLEHLKQLIDGEQLERIFPDGRSDLQRPLERILLRDPSLLDEMRSVGEEALVRAQNARSFHLHADFEGTSTDDIFFRRVQLLRRADIVRMRAAEVERIADGAVLDMKLASSGELGIVTSFLGLASVIEDGSLIFIDEPEISLHPEWQTQYIDLLIKTFENFIGCHFVLATHSPLILADIAPENANVIFLDSDRHDTEASEGFAGRSSDYLLVAAFQVPGKNNLYLKQELIKALRLVANGDVETKEFANIMERMDGLLPKMEQGSPIVKLIYELKTVVNRTIK